MDANTPGAAGYPSSTGPGEPDQRCALGTFAECPHCGGALAPEHAHYRCRSCGWRDSCCD